MNLRKPFAIVATVLALLWASSSLAIRGSDDPPDLGPQLTAAKKRLETAKRDLRDATEQERVVAVQYATVVGQVNLRQALYLDAVNRGNGSLAQTMLDSMASSERGVAQKQCILKHAQERTHKMAVEVTTAEKEVKRLESLASDQAKHQDGKPTFPSTPPRQLGDK